MKAAGGNVKAAYLVSRTILLLLSGFETEVEPDLKELIKKVAQTTLEILRINTNNHGIRDTLLSLFQKLVIIVGTELTPMINELFNLILQNYDTTVISAVLKIAIIVMHSWKQNGLGFIKQVLGFIIKSMTELGLPANQVSDIEKSQIEIVQSYLKFLKSLVVLDLNVLYELPLAQYAELISYLGQCTIYDVEELIKRHSIILVGMIMAGSMGLNLTSENLSAIIATQPSRTSKLIALVPEFSIHTRTLAQRAQEVAIGAMQHVRIAGEGPVLGDIAALHCLVYRFNGVEFLKRIEEWCNTRGVNFAVVKDALDDMQTKSSVSHYKELLAGILNVKPIK